MALFHGDLGFNGKKPCSSSVFHLPVISNLVSVNTTIGSSNVANHAYFYTCKSYHADLLLSFCCDYCSVLCMIKPGLYTCCSDFLWFTVAHQVADYLNTTKESLLMKMAWEMMNPEYKKVFLLSSCL